MVRSPSERLLQHQVRPGNDSEHLRLNYAALVEAPTPSIASLTVHPSSPRSDTAQAYSQQPSRLEGPSNWVRDYYEHPDLIVADLQRGAARIRGELAAASVGRVVEPQEPLSTLELTVLGVGSLLSRRPIPWRSAAKGMEGGANAIRSDAAPSGTAGNNGFLTKEDCAAQGRSDLAARLHQLEETTKSWVTILIPKINAESTRLEITHAASRAVVSLGTKDTSERSCLRRRCGRRQTVSRPRADVAATRCPNEGTTIRFDIRSLTSRRSKPSRTTTGCIA